MYSVFRNLSKKALGEMEESGISPEEIQRIWNEEDVPDIYRVSGAVVVDLQFMNHRTLVVVTKEKTFIIFDGNVRLERWFRNVTRKRRKFLNRSRDFLYHVIRVELEYVNSVVLNLHKEISHFEHQILQNIKREESQIVFNLYEMITHLLDLKRELTYFYRVIVKLKDVIGEEQLDDLRASIDETVSLIELSVSTAQSLLDVHDKVLSMELNLLIKRLTAISIILAVITIVTGIYGMNFRYLPLAEHTHGFWVINGLMALLFVLMWWWFKKIGWM